MRRQIYGFHLFVNLKINWVLILAGPVQTEETRVRYFAFVVAFFSFSAGHQSSSALKPQPILLITFQRCCVGFFFFFSFFEIYTFILQSPEFHVQRTCSRSRRPLRRIKEGGMTEMNVCSIHTLIRFRCEILTPGERKAVNAFCYLDVCLYWCRARG